MKRFSAAARWIRPASIFCHSLRVMVRGNDVERPGAVDRAVLLVVDRERYAHRLDGELGRLLAHGDLVAVHIRQVTHQLAPGCACAAAGAHEFVVESRGRV